MGNLFKTALLLAALTCLVVLIGGAIGGQQGMLIAFVLAAGMNFASYWFSDRIVLSMYRAQPVDQASAPELYGIVRRLATRGGIPMPRVYVIPDDTPNAFATGRNPEHAAVAVTEGIMRILDEDEVEGVLAHELAHVANRDVLISTVAATLAATLPPTRKDFAAATRLPQSNARANRLRRWVSAGCSSPEASERRARKISVSTAPCESSSSSAISRYERPCHSRRRIARGSWIWAICRASCSIRRNPRAARARAWGGRARLWFPRLARRSTPR